jgi:Mg2+ and Co2+ transporter CorA
METPQEKKAMLEHSPPDRFSFFSSQTKEVTTSSTWDALFPDGNLDHMTQEKQKGRPDPNQPIWWIDICDASEGDVDVVAQALSIHPLTAEDIAIREPREKVDVFKNYYLISFQTLVSSATKQERPSIPVSAALYILVFQYGVVTFSPSGSGHVTRARDRVRKMHDPSILTSDWVCYAMMYVALPNSLQVRPMSRKTNIHPATT